MNDLISFTFVGIFLLIVALRYIWLKRRIEKKIRDFFCDLGISVIKIDFNTFELLSRNRKDVYTVVIQKGRAKPRCCRVELGLFTQLTWGYLENVSYCEKCGNFYNSQECYSCPDCTGLSNGN